jgi:hypothetical protein
LQQITSENRRHNLEKRISRTRISPIFYVIMAGKFFPCEEVNMSENLKTMEVLIKYGANFNAKDCIGKTPLHHCAELYHDPSILFVFALFKFLNCLFQRRKSPFKKKNRLEMRVLVVLF